MARTILYFLYSVTKKTIFLKTDLEKEVANLTLEIGKAKQDEFEAQEELLTTRHELDEANQQIEQLKVILYKNSIQVIKLFWCVRNLFR